MDKKDLHKELHDCCEELKELRKKYSNKRSGYVSLPFKILRKKYKLWIPNKYRKNKFPDLVKSINLIKQRAYLMGRLEEIRKNDRK